MSQISDMNEIINSRPTGIEGQLPWNDCFKSFLLTGEGIDQCDGTDRICRRHNEFPSNYASACSESFRIRSNTVCRPNKGSTFFNSGPCVLPVMTALIGIKSAFPLTPVAAPIFFGSASTSATV